MSYIVACDNSLGPQLPGVSHGTKESSRAPVHTLSPSTMVRCIDCLRASNTYVPGLGVRHALDARKLGS